MPKKLYTCKFSGPHNRLPNWGSCKGTENPQESDFPGLWGFITEHPQDWGNGDSWSVPASLRNVRTGGGSSGPTRLSDLPVSVWESPVGARGCQQPAWGQDAAQLPSWEALRAAKSVGRRQPALLPSSGLGQTAGGTRPRPLAENWIQDLLSMALPPEQDPVVPQPVPPIRKSAQAFFSSAIRGWTGFRYRGSNREQCAPLTVNRL